MVSLDSFRNKRPAFADLLNFAAVVADGVVLNKDGSLMAGWYYQGVDLSSSTDDERNNLTMRLNNALRRLGSGWMTHVDAVRFASNTYPDAQRSFFPDPVSRLIDEERRQQFEAEGAHYESMYALVVTYMPPAIVTKGLSRYVFNESEQEKSQGAASHALDIFMAEIASLEDALGGVLRLHRMRAISYVDEHNQKHIHDEFLQYLNFTVTGDNRPVNLPPIPMFLDAVIGGGDYFAGVTPKHDRNLISVLAIDGFPNESVPNVLAVLDRMPIVYRWSTRFIYLDPEEAKKHLDKYRGKWAQQTQNLLKQVFNIQGRVDATAAKRVVETEEAAEEAGDQDVTFGYYTTVIVLRGKKRDELMESARALRRLISNLGFGCRIETLNSDDAFLGSIPGHSVQNVRRAVIHTLNKADLMPTALIWPGRASCPCDLYPPNSPPLLYAATEGSTPFRMNLHVGDVGHFLFFGPTGAGKSVALALIAAQFRRYRNSRIFAFDKGRSLYALTKACGGNHYEIAGDDGDTAFMPLADIDTEGDLIWRAEWVETCLGLQIGPEKVTPGHRAEIMDALRRLRKSPREHRNMTTYVTNVQNAQLREALQYYTLTGAGRMLDKEIESLGDSNFETFEIEELMQKGDKVVLPVLLYLFRKIHVALKGQPTLLLLEEAWIMLAHPVFREKIREWLKVLRKANCIVGLVTNNLSDASRSGILDVLMDQCPTKILLPNHEAMSGDEREGSRKYYQQFGLNDRQIQMIATATPKRDYYVMSPEGRRMISLNVGRVALSFVGIASKPDIERIKELERSYGKKWPEEWLKRRGVDYPAGIFGNN